MPTKATDENIDLAKRKWLTEKQATIYLGIGNHNMFKNWRENFGLPFYIPSGNKILYKRVDLDAFIERTRCEMPANRAS
ncbi:MAG: excisionase [Carboxylicivirga sp.]|jgi:formyltetrahydrofolate hydrolase|nr:excisionase [Carboxylicivirga sp.]